MIPVLMMIVAGGFMVISACLFGVFSVYTSAKLPRIEHFETLRLALSLPGWKLLKADMGDWRIERNGISLIHKVVSYSSNHLALYVWSEGRRMYCSVPPHYQDIPWKVCEIYINLIDKDPYKAVEDWSPYLKLAIQKSIK